MREILFRGKRVDNGLWIEGCLRQYPRGSAKICDKEMQHTFKVDPATVGQYTGLKDKNGKKIFEGDIVRYAIYPPDQFVHGVVNYKDGAFRIGDQGCALCVCAADGIEEYRLEVIGNIHDNPDLMGGEGNAHHAS